MESLKSPRGWAIPVIPPAPAKVMEKEVSLSESQKMTEIDIMPEFQTECETPALVFIKEQKWHKQYEPEKGLDRGTIFPGLDLPFVGERGYRK